MSKANTPYLPTKGYTSDIIALIDAAHEAHVTPILWGDAGVGKTAMIEELAKRDGFAGLTKVMLNTMDRTDVLGLPRGEVITIEGKDGKPRSATVTVYADPAWIVEANAAEGKHFVFLDEFSLADPEMQGSCLTMLQSRHMPSGTPISDNVLFIAAANPTDIITNGYELSPPLSNRLMHIDYKPPVSEWFEGMIDAWGQQVSADEQAFRTMLVSFLQRNPDKVQQEGGDRSMAWASRRSWDNAARIVHRFTDTDMRVRALTGLVGRNLAEQFATFAAGFVLPKPEEIVADPSCVDWKDGTMGYAALVSLTAWMDDASKVDGVTGVFNYAVKNGPKDVPTVRVRPFIEKAVKFRKGKLPSLDFTKDGFKQFTDMVF